MTTTKKALITGITGQSYRIHGLIRRASQVNTQRIDDLSRDPHETDARPFLRHALAAAGVSPVATG